VSLPFTKKLEIGEDAIFEGLRQCLQWDRGAFFTGQFTQQQY